MNRRSFFNAIAIWLAAVFTQEPTTTLSAAKVGSETTMSIKLWPNPEPQTFAVGRIEGGHTFYEIWPALNAPVWLDSHGNIWEFGPNVTKIWPPEASQLQFHRDAFTFSSPRTDAFDD